MCDCKLHNFIRVMPEVALAQAETAEQELMAGRRRGPLHRILYALKDAPSKPSRDGIN